MLVLLIMVIIGLCVLYREPCSHSFERVDDGTERHAAYICTKCGKVKRIKLR